MSKSTVNQGSAEIKQALAHQRRVLKVRLWEERGYTEAWILDNKIIPVPTVDFTLPLPAGVIRLPTCVFCGLTIRHPDNAVLHEWLIKRNFLPVKLQYKIMVAENCTLAHNDCHDKHGQTVAFKLRCAKAQYARYGRDKIVAWVESLSLKQTVWIPEL